VSFTPVNVPDIYNLADEFVDRHLREGRAEKTAVIADGKAWTYREVAEKVNQVGNRLLETGIEPGDRVMLVLPDCPEFVAGYFGSMKIGAVAVPTNTALRSEDYKQLLSESQARVLLADSSVQAEIVPALDGQPHLRHVVFCGAPVHAVTQVYQWDSWLASSSGFLNAARTRKTDVAFWLWTSGSTGSPKAAIHVHQDWEHCCVGYAREILGISGTDITFSSSKLFHAYGLGNALMFPFHAGATTILCPLRPRAEAIFKIVQTHRPTLFFSVPTLYGALLQEAARAAYDFSSVRLAISAAEPLPAEMFRRLKERFDLEVLDGIGSTEMLHIYVSSRPGQARPGSTGQIVPGYEARIVDSEGSDVPPGMIGDLLVKGRSMARTYWNRPDLTSDRMRGEWFFTGDKFRRDEHGYFGYAGRADEMFRVSGQWVSPYEIENALLEHPCVLEAAVVAYQEENELLTPKAFVVLKDGFSGGSQRAQELQEFVKQRIAPYKYPRRVQFFTELPKSAAGKILRFKLRQL